jgi:hypothetical protein
MPSISASVGLLGTNKKHDVALIQAMLRVITNSKGQPYLSIGYDGDFTPEGQTFKAIKAFQEDQKTLDGPPKETPGKIDMTGKTFSKMVELLPGTHKDIRALENFPIVYLAGTINECTAAASRVSSDPKFTKEFKGRLTALINTFYQRYGIVLTVNPDWAHGGFRTFQEQRELMDKIENGEPVTQAGPGESNHNWGNGADVGFSGFGLLTGDSTVCQIPKVRIKGDGPWLTEVAKVNAQAAAQLWKLRDDATTLSPSTLPKDKGHLQTFSDGTVSMVRSLAEHMNVEGCMWWEYKQGAYWSNYGLANQDTKFKVGSAKRIWDKAVNVDETSLATALNQAEARRKVSPLPAFEESIRTGIVELTPNPPAIWKASDIKKAHCDMMRIFFRVDFELSEANYETWKPYTGSGAPI